VKIDKQNSSPLFFLPLILVLDIPFIVYAWQEGGYSYLIAIFYSLLFPLALWSALRLKPWMFVLLSFPILYLSLSFDVLIFDYNSHYNISTWQAVFDSNPEESKEFLGILRKLTWTVGILQILTYLGYLLWSFKFRVNFSKDFRKFSYFFLVAFALSYLSSPSGSASKTFPFGHVLHSFIAYQKQSKLEQERLPQKKAYRYHAIENKEFQQDSTPRTIVVLITESLRRDHQQIYGYPQATTPLMQKEDIITYTNLISPANQTVTVLRRVFSQAEGNNDTLYFTKPSIITAFNEAGYYTAWFSTQSVGKNGESKNSVIAKESDTAVFRNNTHLDTVLLKDLQQALKNPADKKLIFLHVFGVHYLYDHRFPADYAHFSKDKNKDFKQDQINKYDDAIRYNDYLQSEILKQLKQQAGEKLFITFSDHGESLFDSAPNIQGHGALQPGKVEFDIPFVLWFSDEYKQNHSQIYNNVLKNKDLPAINSDFFYSFPYLSGIEFAELKPEKNFFGNTYNRQQKRFVVNSALELLDYDSLK